MKKRVRCWLSYMVFVLLICLTVPMHAMDAEKTVGEVLYHQNFTDISALAESGVCIGTASTPNASIHCEGSELEILPTDNGRVFVLLPAVDRAQSPDFTVEFTFRFTDIQSSNGYIAPILTARGCEPTNVTALPIRADGSVDEFDPTDDALSAAITGGEPIHVKIPVRGGAVDEMLLTANGVEYAITRSSVLMVNRGSLGFVVRNAGVAIDEVFVVCGTDYPERIGYYADHSYANDGDVSVSPPTCTDTTIECAPETADPAFSLPILALLPALGMVCTRRKTRR